MYTTNVLVFYTIQTQRVENIQFLRIISKKDSHQGVILVFLESPKRENVYICDSMN